MRLGIWCFFLTLFAGVSGCMDAKKPECLISKTAMSGLLSDIHLAEKKVDYSGLSPDSAGMVFHAVMKKKVLDSAHVSITCFETSMDYYINTPKELVEIYSMVVDTLAKRNKVLESREANQNAVIEN